MAGGSPIIKAINSAILSYIAQSNALPKSITNRLDKINRQFLWGSTPERKKNSCCGLDKVAKPEHFGGAMDTAFWDSK